MDAPRIVKASLPARLVEAMDRAIDVSPGYPDRAAFLADAVENLLADLTDVSGELPDAELSPDPLAPPAAFVDSRPAPGSWGLGGARAGVGVMASRMGGAVGRAAAVTLTEVETDVATDAARHLNPASPAAIVPDALEARLVLTAPRQDPAVAPEPCTAPDKVTWGMHNRDWPTLWVLADLAARTAEAGAPAEFHGWRNDLGERAADLAYRLNDAGSAFDYVGLPNIKAKGLKSVMRFLSLFVGDRPGTGPLFSLGLAATAEPWSKVCPEPGDRRFVGEREPILLTEAGLALLRRLDGFAPAPAPVADAHRTAWLEHLRDRVPLDFELLCAVVESIAAGHDQRKPLVAATVERLGWADVRPITAETNVAGIIGRAREWNVVARAQDRGRYLLVGDGADALRDLAR